MVEIGRDMVRIRWQLVISLMTLITIRVLQLVVIIDMTRGTLRGRVFSRERKCRQRMIKRCRAPRRSRMTRLTIVTVIPCHVIRICRQLEVALMTLITACILKLIVAINMA